MLDRLARSELHSAKLWRCHKLDGVDPDLILIKEIREEARLHGQDQSRCLSREKIL